MKINDKHFPLVPFAVLFCCVYLLFAGVPIKKDLHITPQWTIDIEKNPVQYPASAIKLLPFKLNGKMGYYTPDGTLAAVYPFEQKAAVSENFWTVYANDAQHTPFYTPDGKQCGTLDDAGFPFFEKSAAFVFHPGGNSFSRHDKSGKKLWAYKDYAPITAFSASAAGCAAGFADGKLLCVDNEGNISGSFYPGGSETQVIFGCALSENGKYCACISGLNTQRLIVAAIENEKIKIIYHEYLSEAVREQTLVRFSRDGKYVFFNTKKGLHSVHIAQKKAAYIPFDGKITALSDFGSNDIFFVLSKKSGMYTVSVLYGNAYKKGSFSFKGGSAFLHAGNGSIYIGCDNRISKMNVAFR